MSHSKPHVPLTTPSKRTATATLFRGYIVSLKKMGWLPAVRERVSPEVVELIDRPPFPTQWINVRAHEEVMAALGELAGDPALRQLGYEASRDACGPIITPIIRTLMAISGASPATIFAKLGRISAVVLRGSSFLYTPRSPASGTLEIRIDDPAPRASFVCWEGALASAYDLTDVKGSVAPCVTQPGGCAATYELQWDAT